MRNLKSFLTLHVCVYDTDIVYHGYYKVAKGPSK